MNITAYTLNKNYVVTISSGRKKKSVPSVPKGQGISPHSEYSARRRAFNRGSAIIYCNQHILNTFVTLTYAAQHNDYQKIKNDLKNHFSRKGISYIAVVERHKSGYFHLHAITSNLPNVISLRKGKKSWSDWGLGFSDVKFISGTDDKFKIAAYIFKYMNKGEKIGGRYFLKSRDLTVKRFSYPFGAVPSPIVNDLPIDYMTYNIYTKDTYKMSVERRYYYGHKNTNKTTNPKNGISQR